MCTICKKFKKGTIDVEEAKDMLDEMVEYLSEEHIEEVEQMIFEAEDTFNYMNDRRLDKLELDGLKDEYDDEDYAPEEDLHEVSYDDDEDDD